MDHSSLSLQVLVFWFLNILVDTAGQLEFKAGALKESHHENMVQYYLNILRNHWILLGIGCYVVEFFLWLIFLTLVPLSNGILLGSINIVAILFAGKYFFKERITPLKLVGIVLVTLGVALVGANT